ncbi:MAG: 4-alpha-glucanotransferase, partial [Actinomycetota bacterium]|nr:4-alpha-glucanotransferase [Actinomycetota bacterium]
MILPVTTDAEHPLGADEWGIHSHWTDAHDNTTAAPAETVRRLREVVGAPPADLEEWAPIVTRPGRDLGLGRVEVESEDGRSLVVDGVLAADFPLGYHRLRTASGVDRRLIVSPGRCWLPSGWRAWGFTVQLYAARSRTSWGMGDLGDLRAIRQWSQGLGAGFLLINPLHAVAPTRPQEASPYLPATRRFRNPIYLRVEDVPGADRVDLAAWSARATSYDDAAPIDRDVIWTLKRDALAAIFEVGDSSAECAAWVTAQGQSLHDFATWCVLAESYGPDWRRWPAELQQPGTREVTAFAAENAARVSFYGWLQWLLDIQLRAACGDLNVLQDLPIGVDGGGADAWAWRDTLASGVQVGAPPDVFNQAGQNWGSPPLVPWRLRAADYAPFIESIRATMASAGGIRIDHVMGLFRLWWVPEGASPAQGAYVRYPSDDLLDIVALESHRAQSLVVGEDLGTVEVGVRDALTDHQILSYRLLYFEDDDPADWPTTSMAAVTTHDLPTVAGLWTGSDVEEQARYVTTPRDTLARGREQLLSRWRDPAGIAEGSSTAQVIETAHRWLGRVASTLVSATLEDAGGEERRPNLPGAHARENWCLPLAVKVEDLAH